MEYTREVLDQNGKYLDKKSYKDLFPSLKEDSFYDLFYYKQNDVFITISEKEDSVGQKITDEFLDRQYRETYLDIVLPPNDFFGVGGDVGATYESELNTINTEMILETGKKIEESELYILYYLEYFDLFVALEPVLNKNTNVIEKVFTHTFQSTDLRKKYNIPFQDERFNDL